MRSVRRSLRCAIACLTLIAACTPASATHSSGGCTKTYTVAADCPVTFTGPPIYIYAEGTATGAVGIHAWVNVDEVVGAVSQARPYGVLDCAGNDTNFTSCEASFPNDTTQLVVNAAAQFHFRCWGTVTGKAAIGSFVCRTGAGR